MCAVEMKPTTSCSDATGRISWRSMSSSIDGEDLRGLPLVERKRRLARIMPRVESRLLLLEAIPVADVVSSSWPANVTGKASWPSIGCALFVQYATRTCW